VGTRASQGRTEGDVRLERIALATTRYRWPIDRSVVTNGPCPECGNLLRHVLSCSESADGWVGRLMIGSIMRGPE
jgi:hypothetical protein